jgi:single-strand DNA-binding protein
MSLNRVQLIGYVGRDPETRYGTSGGQITNFSVATNGGERTSATGERIELVEWHRITAFGKLAETCAQYLRKGRQVYVEGRLQTREWTDQDGAKRRAIEIIAGRVDFLGKADAKATEPAGADDIDEAMEH